MALFRCWAMILPTFAGVLVRVWGLGTLLQIWLEFPVLVASI